MLLPTQGKTFHTQYTMNHNAVNKKIFQAGKSCTQVARELGCTPVALSQVANGHKRIRWIVAKLVRRWPDLRSHFKDVLQAKSA